MAINRLFFRGTTAPTVAVASPQVALVTVPVVHEVTPEISREPTPDLPPAVLPEAAAHATAEASAEASAEETPEVSAEAPAGVTELVPVPERHDTTRLEDDPVAPAAIAAAPDPDAERLLARCARLQAQMLDFTARLADMEQQVRSYEQHQFLALGDVVGECLCLRLRQEYLSLKAARSGSTADREQARQADADFDAYRRGTEHTPTPLPELDDDEQDELRRLYRAAAMRCHPDRAEEAERAEAHDVFLRVQAAYQARDLDGLRSITAELAGWARESDEASPAQAGTVPASSAVRRRVAELQIQVADLMLAVQTLQLDPAYRQAVQVERWEANFAEARAGFEAECEALRAQIARLGSRPA
ncbi:molecular chaperone DnaJ [Thauera sp.]|uniref:molecular chaperone DnaJ n=1 Tax=Thauera sp. TaxID=1905334 RepID=UPI002B5D7F70|nr:molecular chaperone DnaJ [Thauera sp.]HRO35547.1 DnaJ domain-containing protein [Thauera sp.]